MDLKESREIINEIDAQIVALFVRRMETVAGLARVKRDAGLPVRDAAREAVVLDRAAALAGAELGDYARALFERMMALSRDYQEKLLETRDQDGDGA